VRPYLLLRFLATPSASVMIIINNCNIQDSKQTITHLPLLFPKAAGYGNLPAVLPIKLARISLERSQRNNSDSIIP
jgi:hypothetical protein